MKLQSASRKEITRIAAGTLVCDVIMIAALFLLSLVGVGKFEAGRILLGAVCGSIIAILNFTILCLTVQSAVEMESKRKMKARFQLSYNVRMVIQAGWVVLSFVIPQIHFVAGAAPVLFPNVTILFLQATGRLMPKDEKKAEEAEAKDTSEGSEM